MKTANRIIWYFVVSILTFIIAFPLLWMIMSSFKSPNELFGESFTFFPQRWTMQNYIDAWNSAPWKRFFINTFLVAIIVVIAQTITCTLAGYALSVLKFRAQPFVFLCIVGANMIPFEAALIPQYLLVARTHMLDTYVSLIFPTTTSVLGIFIMRQNFMSIPRELFEAAELDYASPMKSFLRIAIPLSRTSLATVSLFAFLNSWNSYIWPLTITTKTEMRTIQIGLSYMIDADLGTQWGALMAAATFIIVPVLIVFLLLQKYFVKGIMRTGIK